MIRLRKLLHDMAADVILADMEHVDVLIVGAGLSGIGAACHLQREAPGVTYDVVEARAASGGTWDLFSFPGIRSDSDMYTLGYTFRPWKQPNAIAGGKEILRYLRETAAAYGVDRQITYHCRVVRADWSAADARWTVTVEHTGTGERAQRTCGFLYLCSGYYRYDQGYRPQWPGQQDFTGTMVHPQHWPADLDVAGRRVVVIGSGATAVTIVPALAEAGARVTILQRSPSYVLSLPGQDPSPTCCARCCPSACLRGGAVEERADRDGTLQLLPQAPGPGPGDAPEGRGQALDIELRGTRVRVCALGPGVIDTAIVATSTMRGEWEDRRARTIDLYTRRGTSPNVVARQALAAVTHGRRIVPAPRYQVVPHWMLKRVLPPAGRALSAATYRYLKRSSLYRSGRPKRSGSDVVTGCGGNHRARPVRDCLRPVRDCLRSPNGPRYHAPQALSASGAAWLRRPGASARCR